MSEESTEATAIESGARQLDGEELRRQIADKAVRGDYLDGYTYTVFFDAAGTMQGVNNTGARHFGRWTVDEQTKTLSVEWDLGWDNTTCRAYDMTGSINFYDSDTGMWRTRFREFTPPPNSPPSARRNQGRLPRSWLRAFRAILAARYCDS